MENDTLTISGVVKDFNFQSLHNALDPMVIRYTDQVGVIAIKAHAGKTEQTIAEIRSILNRINPGVPFEVNFLEDDLAKLYENEARIGTLSKAFALLAIFISCLGLYGLIVFAAEQRTKEIGIRKVLGASVSSLTTLLSSSFLRLMLISILISASFTWYFMNGWLDDFAFHIEIKWWMFVVAGSISLAIAVFTVSFQCFKAAVANPVKSLRSE